MGKIGLSHIESSLSSINSLDTDYLAEVVAATLIEEGVSPDSIQITRLGSSPYESRERYRECQNGI